MQCGVTKVISGPRPRVEWRWRRRGERRGGSVRGPRAAEGEGGLLDLFELFHLLQYRAVEVSYGLVFDSEFPVAHRAADGRVGNSPHLVPADACVNIVHDILRGVRGLNCPWGKRRQLVDTASGENRKVITPVQ